MRIRNILIVVFIIVSVVQLAVPANMIYKYQQILAHGKLFKFKIAPVDPSDPFRGKFVRLRMDEDRIKVDTLNHWQRNEIVYLKIEIKSDGFVRVLDLSRDKPASGGDFIKARVDYETDNSVVIEYPFNKYYLEESKAPEAERVYFKASGDSSKTSFVTVNVIDGDAVLNDLIISGKSIKDIYIK